MQDYYVLTDNLYINQKSKRTDTFYQKKSLLQPRIRHNDLNS